MLWHHLATTELQTSSSDLQYNWGAQTWTRWCGANGRLPAAHLLQWWLVVGWPGIPHRSFMLDLKHCQSWCHHDWSWSWGGTTTRSAHPLTHGLMRWLQPRLAEVTSAHPIERSRHSHFHHERSPCYHSNDSPLAQKSNLNHNPNLSNGKCDNSRVKWNKHWICPNYPAFPNFRFWCPFSWNMTWSST
jgi:hypothetical protein